VGVNIHIPADEVWSFFQKNKDRCTKEMIAIAENSDTEYAVYLTEDEGYPLFSVCKGDAPPEYEEGAISENDCTKTAKNCFLKYLFPVVVTNKKAVLDSTGEDITAQEMEDAVYEREDELLLAMGDFLQVVLQEGKDGTDIIDTYGSDVVMDILDYFLEHLANDQCFEIYRPTIITDEDTGSEIYVEFPYETDAPFENPYESIEDDSVYGGGWE